MIPLLVAVEGKDLARSFIYGYITGIVTFIGQMWWLNVAHPLAPFAVSIILGAYIGFFSLLYRFVQGSVPVTPLITIPALWVSTEFARQFGAIAFPVGMLGYSQHNYLPVIQFADIGGVYALSFLIALINASFYIIVKNIYSRRHIIRSVVIAVLIITFILGYGSNKMQQYRQAGKTDFKVAVIQPNINYYAKNYDAHKALDVVDGLTMQAIREKPDLIAWPETVIEQYSYFHTDALEKLLRRARKYNNYLLYGSPREANSNGEKKIYNSAFLLSPANKFLGVYDKQHLIPVFENFSDYLIRLGFTRSSRGTYAAGSDFTMFRTPKANFAVTICFDALFPDLVGQLLNSGGQFMINIADDSWSSSATEHYQHASMNIFRAVENRIYYVRAANSGISMAISPLGKVEKFISVYKRGFFIANISPKKGKTIYNLYGDFVAYLSFALTINAIIFAIILGFFVHFETIKKQISE